MNEMKLIRAILGALILFFDRLTQPKSLERMADKQKQVDEEARSLVLYQLHACPFCVKVRRQVKRLGLQIEMKDIGRDAGAAKELVTQGGEDQVPCLRISEGGSVKWMYESSAINEYLQGRFGQSA